MSLLTNGVAVPAVRPCLDGPQRSLERDDAIRFMSFNVRGGLCDWGCTTIWQMPLRRTHRRSAVAACIRDHRPDFCATQEALMFQRRHIHKDLHGEYDWIGRSRGTAWWCNDSSAIFYDTTRWSLMTAGNGEKLAGDFMLSPTPEKWGSRHPEGSWPQIATWGVFRHRSVDDCCSSSAAKQTILIVNTHLESESNEVRIKQAEQTREEAERLRVAHDCSQAILMGDFNADFTEEPYKTFPKNGWRDLYLECHDRYEPRSFTYHNFLGSSYEPQGYEHSDPPHAIDFIFAKPSSGVEVLAANFDKKRYTVDGANECGIYPSDHYPLVVDVVLS
eukprot:TRINITY_DN62446_c0_g1_i1.p1 TRINITY_DN62446_c0_g1~~TRINITY_DN62446_c0_g1_i1.p1  ORF type:complete len:332 (+),score=41.97 TRINITY_DN62446_c0_g1_i1:67-1062(+)